MLTGKKEQFLLHSQALMGNLIGDSPDRSVHVYLPPSYAGDNDRRYPVLYMLHGFTDSDIKWFGAEEHWINLPAIADSAIQNEVPQEMIIVMPNAHNSFKGSMYSTSVTVGDWETFVARELVDHIDANYRTLANKDSRGLAGHSMGGYGTIRLAMKYPDTFGAIYMLSACCMGTNVFANEGLMKNVAAVTSKEQLADQPFFVAATLASAAAWAPNPNKAPLFLDVPFKDGKVDEEIINKYHANAPLFMLDQYIPHIKKLNAIALDAGAQDFGISGATKQLHERLEAYGIQHVYESYEGDHVNKIGERIYSEVLPFFSKELVFGD
ncbi:MAG: esterase [Saprospiraceae bacterium]|nr:esterase [Saprospiraceae bacterium]